MKIKKVADKKQQLFYYQKKMQFAYIFLASKCIINNAYNYFFEKNSFLSLKYLIINYLSRSNI